MCHATAKVKKWGNSLGAVIPKKIVKELKLEEGEIVDIDIEKKRRINGFGMFRGAKVFEEQREHKDLV